MELILTDGLGVAYSTIRGNGENVLIYSAALATPFAGAIFYKGGKKILNLYVKKNSANMYDLAIKEAFEEHAGWYKCSNDVPINEANLVTAKAELNGSSKLNDVTQSERKVLYEVAENARFIINAVEENGFVIIRGENNEVVGRAWLSTGNEMNLTIKTSGTILEGRGREVFNSLYKFINDEFDEVITIRGTWRTNENFADNLNTFNQLISDGLIPNEAALKTFTGKMSIENGFINANVLSTSVINANGSYSSVDVIFSK